MHLLAIFSCVNTIKLLILKNEAKSWKPEKVVLRILVPIFKKNKGWVCACSHMPCPTISMYQTSYKHDDHYLKETLKSPINPPVAQNMPSLSIIQKREIIRESFLQVQRAYDQAFYK